MKAYKLQKLKRRLLFLIHIFIKNIFAIKIIFKNKKIYILIIGIMLIFIFLFYPITQIKLYVNNKKLITNTELMQIRYLVKRNNFFLLNPQKIRILIMHNFKNISDIQIQKELPGQIQLVITETNYLGVLHIEDKLFLLTNENQIIPIDPKILQNQYIKTLPSIFSTTYNPIFLKNIHELITQYNQILLNAKIQTNQKRNLKMQKIYNIISLNQIPTIEIKTPKYIFLLSPTKDLKKQIIMVKVLITNPSLKYTNFKIIDLRFDRPVIK